MSDSSNGRGCLWPMWDHSDTPDHTYCGGERVDGQSYCAAHYARSIRNPDEVKTTFVPRRLAA